MFNNHNFKYYFNIADKKVPFIHGGKGGCFAEGTLISTANGQLAIEDIRVDTYVTSYDSEGNFTQQRVTQIHIHEQKHTVHVFKLWNKTELVVTDNHWILTPDGDFLPASLLKEGDCLVQETGTMTAIASKTTKEVDIVYNLTVENNHTYIANNILVHNKGGGKGATAAPGVESPNNLFSTDIMFVTVALSEGPVYRINPNGPQDIEINDGNIDDLLNLSTDGTINTEYFYTDSTTGTLTQTPLNIFGEETVVPQSLSNPVTLKKGNLEGIPRAAVVLQNTSVSRIDVLRFVFVINALQTMDDKGNVFSGSVATKITVYDNTGSNIIAEKPITIDGKTNVQYKYTVDIPIPEASKSSSGHRFTIEKTSNDSDSSKIQDAIQFISWDEITHEDVAYTRTAVIGYAIKAVAEYRGGIPTFTSIVKGMLCKVPSNYNQPIIPDFNSSTFQVDWREIEVVNDPTGTNINSYQANGYRLQATGSTVLTEDNPEIYKGFWDGTFSYAWTQNPAWILYDILTNSTYGLGIPEANIDKYRFYKIAQYCDAVNPKTGRFDGVVGYSDSTFRYKPRNRFTAVNEALIGLNAGIAIKERRFICDLLLSSQAQVFDIIQKVAAIFRGVLFYSGGKITLNVDLPDEVPVAHFSEANIIKDSVNISGIKESELITGVEISYIEPNNHYKRETVRVDDPQSLRELNQIENVKQIEATGCTRRGQAIRFAQYLIASTKYIRRKIDFTVPSEAVNLTIGDVISVSQRMPGTAWGYAGRVASNSVIGEDTVILEHFTSPALSQSVFTSNTKPLALRVINMESDRLSLYLLSNTFSADVTGNTQSGIDLVEVAVSQRFIPDSKTFSTFGFNIDWTSNNVPVKGDLWSIGEIDPSNFYTNQGEKLFKVNQLTRRGDDQIQISASEYVSNVYIDSDTLINYIPVKYIDTISPLIAPPAPILNVIPRARRLADGSTTYELEIDARTDTSAYPLDLRTEFEYASPSSTKIIERIN